MPTSSFTKQFIISDRKVYDKLLEELNSPSDKYTVKKDYNTSYLEDGEKLLKKYFNANVN